jgi:hypothetical protein
MNKFFLHVGPHKTGTTSIQKFFVDNRAICFQSNLIYPQRMQSIFGHHPFRDLVDKEALGEEDIQFFNNENRDFLLSSEDLISLGRDKFQYLRHTLDSKQLVVVFAWRRASFKLYSIWQETIKHGGTQTFFSYYHDHLARPGQSQMLSADLKLNMFCHVFGKQNVRVIDYDASAANNSLIQDFVSAVDLKWDANFVTPEKNPDAVNRSMSLADIEIIRALNQIFKTRYNIQGSWVRNKYQELTEKLCELGVPELKHIIGHYESELKVGNYLIDNRGEKIMTEKYSDNLLNYEPNTQIKVLKVAQPDWIFEPVAQKIVNDLTEFLQGQIG